MTTNSQPSKPISWEDFNLEAHGQAWMLARTSFTETHGHEPECTSDFSEVAQQAEKIRKGE